MPDDDLEDAASRNANRRYVERSNRRPTRMGGRWVPHRPWRATPGDWLMTLAGAIILLIILIGFAVERFG